MRLRRAVLQIPALPFVSPWLLFYKTPSPLTRLESTLLQLLIPFNLKSFRCNTYKKPRGGPPFPVPEFSNSLLLSPRHSASDQTPATSSLSYNSEHFRSPIGAYPASLPPSSFIFRCSLPFGSLHEIGTRRTPRFKSAPQPPGLRASDLHVSRVCNPFGERQIRGRCPDRWMCIARNGI